MALPKTLRMDKDFLPVIMKMREEGKGQREIAKLLHKMGHRTVFGKQITQSDVSAFLRQNGVRSVAPYTRKAKGATKKPKQKEPVDSLLRDVDDLVSSNLGPALKEKILRSMLA